MEWMSSRTAGSLKEIWWVLSFGYCRVLIKHFDKGGFQRPATRGQADGRIICWMLMSKGQWRTGYTTSIFPHCWFLHVKTTVIINHSSRSHSKVFHDVGLLMYSWIEIYLLELVKHDWKGRINDNGIYIFTGGAACFVIFCMLSQCSFLGTFAKKKKKKVVL